MKDYLVYKSNDIINASYSLTVKEQRLLLACISQIKSDEELSDKNSFTLTVDEARDLFYSKKDRYNAYRDLVMATEKLFDRRIIMHSEEGKKERLTRWVSTVDFDHEEMTATLYFHDQIKPYISQLKDNFTKYRLKHIAELSSIYAIRVYEMIASWHSQNKSFQEMTIDDFRNALDLGLKYKQFGQLRERVIKPAIEQINERTNYDLEIQATKRGRSFHKLQFRFNQKEADKLEEEKRKLKREQQEADRLAGIEHRDDDTLDMFNNLSDKQITFIAQNHVFQEHLGGLGRLPTGEKYGSERVVESSISFLKKGDFDEVTKYVIQGTLKKVKQQ